MLDELVSFLECCLLSLCCSQLVCVYQRREDSFRREDNVGRGMVWSQLLSGRKKEQWNGAHIPLWSEETSWSSSETTAAVDKLNSPLVVVAEETVTLLVGSDFSSSGRLETETWLVSCSPDNQVSVSNGLPWACCWMSTWCWTWKSKGSSRDSVREWKRLVIERHASSVELFLKVNLN